MLKQTCYASPEFHYNNTVINRVIKWRNSEKAAEIWSFIVREITYHTDKREFVNTKIGFAC